MPSSISSSDTKAVVYIKVLLAVCVVVVVSIELWARHSLTSYSMTYRRVSRQYREAVRAQPSKPGERVSVLIVGNSLLLDGINEEHLRLAWEKKPGNHDVLRAVSLIDEDRGRRVRMGHLAFVGSHRINGVSALHTDLMQQTVFHVLHQLYPDRIVNETNGISFRRWLMQANPGLSKLLWGWTAG